MPLPKPQAILDLEHRYSLQIPDLSDQGAEEIVVEQDIYFRQDASGAVTELCLRHCMIETMEWVSDFPALTILDLQSNQISKIEGLDNLMGLTWLDLSSNPISKIEGLEALTNLTGLYLLASSISKIEGLETLTSLTELDLSFSSISKLEGLDALTSLTKLFLSGTSISKVEGLEALTSLTELYLSGTPINKIEGLDALTSLTTLDLSGTLISKIEGLDALTSLTTLDLSIFPISKLEGLDALTSLTELYLSGTSISKIEGLDGLTSLTKLHLSGTSISKIEGLGALTSLTSLNLSNTSISKIEGLDALTSLTKLDLSGTSISKIEGLDALTSLDWLNLSGTSISKIAGLEALTNLTKLSLSGTSIGKLEGLDALTSLTELDLRNNPISKLEGLDALTSLTELDLSRTSISKIEGLDSLTSLTKLDLSGTPIGKIEGLDGLTSLTELVLRSNPISKLEGLAVLTNLTKLDLSGTSIGKLEGLETLTSLTKLFLLGTSISKLEGLEALTSLTVLNLSGASISKIEGLEALTSLTELGLRNNPISKLEGLDALTSLTKLSLSGTSISKLEGLETLTSLTELSLSGTSISKIEGLEALTNLNWLVLSYNQISKLEGLDALTRLNHLNLSGNQIREIEGLKVWIDARRERGGSLLIHANPFLEEIGLVLNDDENHFPYLRDYFARQEEERSDYTLPCKVMLLGNHQAGKSTFLHRYDPEYEKHQDSTHVLQVHRTTGPAINFYDFGGQDYYHGIYQAFFTLDTLCLLFWRRDKDYNGIDEITSQGNGGAGKPKTLHFDRLYWLGQIEYAYRRRQRLFGKDPSASPSPSTICIQTHADTPEARQSTLGAEASEHVLEEHVLSLISGERHHALRVSALIARVRELAQRQPSIKATNKEVELHNHIKAQQSRRDGRAYRATRVADLLEAIGVSGDPEDRWRRYLEQLSRRGEVLYYIEHEELRDYVWLSPSATVAYVHRHILGRKHICRGELRPGFFDSLAQSEEDKEDRRLGLLLEHEQVIFSKGGDEEKDKGYIVPGYLPLLEESPDGEWLTMGLGPAHLQLYFERFIPFGLINQLICHYGREGRLVKYFRDQILFTIGLEETSQDERKPSAGLRFETNDFVFVEEDGDEPTKPRYRLARQDDYKVWIRLDLSQRLISVAICPIGEREDKSETRQHLERIILDDLLRLYWGGSTYRPEREPIDDLYLAYMGEGERASEPLFVKLKKLDDEGETTQGRILAYPLTKRAGGSGLPERLVLNREKGREVSARPYQHLSTNQHLSTLKRVFISYSKEDELELGMLLKYLKPLEQSGRIEVYYDRRTDMGAEIHEVIRERILGSDCVIALVSQDFLTTDYITQVELPLIEEYGKRLFPFIIKPCTWLDCKIISQTYVALKGEIPTSDIQLLPHAETYRKHAKYLPRENNLRIWVAFINEFKTKLNIQ